MKAVDTNILLRFLVRDDEAQAATAAAFFRKRTTEDPAFVSLIVLAELVWNLRQRYGYPRATVNAKIAALLETAELVFEDETEISAIVNGTDRGELADHLIAYCARRAGCSSTVTFDKRAAAAIPSMELLA